MVDENDAIVGHVNKYLSHRFVPGTPRGILHRAFSVFLFDHDGKLLLQKASANLFIGAGNLAYPDAWNTLHRLACP